MSVIQREYIKSTVDAATYGAWDMLSIPPATMIPLWPSWIA